jgi:PAS domain S-box-containing protein
MQTLLESRIGGSNSTSRRAGLAEAPPRGEGEWRPVISLPAAAGGAERRLKLIIESVPVGLFLTNPGGETLAMNRAALALLGVARLDDALGKDVRRIVRDEESGALGDFIARVCSGTSEPLAHIVTGPAGDRALEIHGVSMQRSDGDAPVFLGAICDVTQHAAAQATLKNMESRHAQLEAEREELREALSDAQRETARERARADALQAEQDAWRAALSELIRDPKTTGTAASADVDAAPGSSWQF